MEVVEAKGLHGKDVNGNYNESNPTYLQFTSASK
jgi:hypothetical protein